MKRKPQGLTLPGFDGVYVLERERTGKPVEPGTVLRRGFILGGGRPPHNLNSSGRVWPVSGAFEVFPSVVGLRWRRVRPDARPRFDFSKLKKYFKPGEAGFLAAVERLESRGAISMAKARSVRAFHSKAKRHQAQVATRKASN